MVQRYALTPSQWQDFMEKHRLESLPDDDDTEDMDIDKDIDKDCPEPEYFERLDPLREMPKKKNNKVEDVKARNEVFIIFFYSFINFFN